MSVLDKTGGILESCLRSSNQNYNPKFNPKEFNTLKLHQLVVRPELNSARKSRISTSKFLLLTEKAFSTLDILFHHITTLTNVCMAFVFGLQSLDPLIHRS